MDIKKFRFLAAVEVFLLSPDRKKVLLMRRSPDRDFMPGLYAGIGGKMDSSGLESPLEAALRETREESAYGKNGIRDLRLKGLITVHDRWGRWIVFEFTGAVRKMKYVRRTVKKEGVLEWVPVADLGKLNLIQDLQNGALEKILFSREFLWMKSAYDAKDRLIRFSLTRAEDIRSPSVRRAGAGGKKLL